MKPWLGILLLAAVATPALAATRDELKREREAIEADYAARAASCRKQFVVTPCLDKVRADKQKALSQVVSQENALDAAERQKRAEAREKRLAEKGTPDAPASAAPAASASPASPAAPSEKTPKAHINRLPDRSAEEREKRAAFEARQKEIEAHRQKVEQRNAERAQKKPAPRPLPVPASAGSR